MVDFGRDQVCPVPGGSVVERSWDLRAVEEPGKYSRPRLLDPAAIEVHVRLGAYLIEVHFANAHTPVGLPTPELFVLLPMPSGTVVSYEA